MWGSGQQQSIWGWPSNVNNNHTVDQESFDPSQGWAAAAALWAQQRQLQEQYKNGNEPPLPDFEPPPEPPGPPPVRPSIPHLDAQPITPSVHNIEVHDYMHGKAQLTQPPTEVIDYQHGKISERLPAAFDYKNNKSIDENPVEWEVTSDNWQDHRPLFHNGGWNQDGWNGDQMSYYSAAAKHYQKEYDSSSAQGNSEKEARNYRSMSVSSEGHKTDKINHKSKQIGITTAKVRPESSKTTGNISFDVAETSRRAKVLPLWLRQGLEKMEQEKKKQLDRNKPKEESLPATSDLANQDSPKSSLDKENKVTSESDEETEKNVHSKEISAEPRSDAESEEEEEEEDEGERFQRMMLKVKTWMTEILLGVTNTEIRDVSNEIYFEFKRSVKVKATQVRRSGGLEALRAVGQGGDGDSTTSDSESESEAKSKNKTSGYNISNKIEKEDATCEINHKNELKREQTTNKDINSEKRFDKKSELRYSDSKYPAETKSTNCAHTKIPEFHKDVNDEKVLSTTNRLTKSNSSSSEDTKIPPRRYASPPTNDSSSSDNETKSHRVKGKQSSVALSEERLQYYRKLLRESRKMKQRKSSTTDDDDDDDKVKEKDDDSEKTSDSENLDTSDSEDYVRHSKSKRRRTKDQRDSLSPRRHKKRSKVRHKDSSSDSSDHRKRRKRRGSSSSTNSESFSSAPQKKSNKKKNKRRSGSRSRSSVSKRKR